MFHDAAELGRDVKERLESVVRYIFLLAMTEKIIFRKNDIGVFCRTFVRSSVSYVHDHLVIRSTVRYKDECVSGKFFEHEIQLLVYPLVGLESL